MDSIVHAPSSQWPAAWLTHIEAELEQLEGLGAMGGSLFVQGYLAGSHSPGAGKLTSPILALAGHCHDL